MMNGILWHHYLRPFVHLSPSSGSVLTEYQEVMNQMSSWIMEMGRNNVARGLCTAAAQRNPWLTDEWGPLRDNKQKSSFFNMLCMQSFITLKELEKLNPKCSQLIMYTTTVHAATQEMIRQVNEEHIQTPAYTPLISPCIGRVPDKTS